MPRKQKPVPQAAPPETASREMPLTFWVGSLLKFESEERDLLAAGAGPEALSGVAARLGYTLLRIRQLSFSTLRAGAAAALPEVERFVSHPGRYVEPAQTVYWDWTMDANSTEEIPAAELTVADAARRAVEAIRGCLPTDLPDGDPPLPRKGAKKKPGAPLRAARKAPRRQ